VFYALQQCKRVLVMSEMSVCLSVRPSVKRVNCDKTKKNFCQNSYTTRKKQSFQFCDKENGWWGTTTDHFYLKFLAKQY